MTGNRVGVSAYVLDESSDRRQSGAWIEPLSFGQLLQLILIQELGGIARVIALEGTQRDQPVLAGKLVEGLLPARESGMIGPERSVWWNVGLEHDAKAHAHRF